jgi:hypothetical protein
MFDVIKETFRGKICVCTGQRAILAVAWLLLSPSIPDRLKGSCQRGQALYITDCAEEW